MGRSPMTKRIAGGCLEWWDELAHMVGGRHLETHISPGSLAFSIAFPREQRKVWRRTIENQPAPLHNYVEGNSRSRVRDAWTDISQLSNQESGPTSLDPYDEPRTNIIKVATSHVVSQCSSLPAANHTLVS